MARQPAMCLLCCVLCNIFRYEDKKSGGIVGGGGTIKKFIQVIVLFQENRFGQFEHLSILL